MIVVGKHRDLEIHLNDSQHDDNDKEEKCNVKSKSPVKVLISWGVQFITDTASGSYSGIQMELETRQHVIAFKIILAIFALIVITAEKVEGQNFTFVMASKFLGINSFRRRSDRTL